MISFDLETYLFSATVQAPKPVVASFWDGTTAELIRFPEAWARIERMLDSDEVVCGANIVYDFGIVSGHCPRLLPKIFAKYERGQVFDVQIQAFLDHVARGEAPSDTSMVQACGKFFKRFSLEACVAVYLNRLDAKANDEYRLRYGELDALPTEQWPEVARTYPIDDVRNTYDVAQVQLKFCQNNSNILAKSWSHQTHHARAAFCMQLGSIWGIQTDKPYVEALEARLTAEYAKYRSEWQKLGLVRPDGKDDARVIKRMVIEAYAGGIPADCNDCQGTGKVKGKGKTAINCKACGGTGYQVPAGVPTTDGGGISAGKDTLQQSGNETLERFYETSKLKKPLTTFIPILKAGGHYSVHMRPNALVETGRASYAGGIQQMPRAGGTREAFIPSPGNVFCSNDYTALELCSLSQCCLTLGIESKMAELINADVDLHSYFGAKLLNIELDEFLARKKAKEKLIDAYRFGAKAVNFGLPGGMGVAKFIFAQRQQGMKFCVLFGEAETCGEQKVTSYNEREITPTCTKCISIVERLKKEWFKTFPEIPEYFNWVKKHPGIKSNEGVLEAVGTGYVRGGLGFSDMANTSFQHLAAMGAKHALWNVTKACYDRSNPLYASHVLIFLHDELFIEMPESRASEAGFEVEKLMVSSMQEFIPDVKIKAPPALMRRWSKAADTVIVDGKLVPWEPKLDSK